MSARRQKQARYKCTSVNDERDRVRRAGASHCSIDSRTVIGGSAATEPVLARFQIAVKCTANLRCPDISHSGNRCRCGRRAQTGNIDFIGRAACDRPAKMEPAASAPVFWRKWRLSIDFRMPSCSSATVTDSPRRSRTPRRPPEFLRSNSDH